MSPQFPVPLRLLSFLRTLWPHMTAPLWPYLPQLTALTALRGFIRSTLPQPLPVVARLISVAPLDVGADRGIARIFRLDHYAGRNNARSQDSTRCL